MTFPNAAKACLRSLVVALCLHVACGDGVEEPDDPVASGLSSEALISDQAHGKGKQGFLFYPPIAQNFTRLGNFEARLTPEVRIDEIDAQGKVQKNIASYVGAASSFGERLRRNRRAEFYGVRFRSANAKLDPARTYRITVSVGGGALGFADIDVVKNRIEALRVDRNQYVPLVSGDTLPIRFAITKSAVDKDGDGVFDWLDNCPNVRNPPVSLPGDIVPVSRTAPSGCNADATDCDPQEEDLNPIIVAKQPDSDHDGIGDACDCPAGYQGGGSVACTDIDECALKTAGCDPLTTCTNLPGSFSCGACPAGYIGDGKAGCQDIDECAASASPCGAGQVCTNQPGTYSCVSCAAGTFAGAAGCVPCSPVPNCTGSLACTNASNSACSACAPGYFSDGRQCVACTPVPGCIVPVTCTSSADSQCVTKCGNGVVEPGEVCDNAGQSGSCCSATCTLESASCRDPRNANDRSYCSVDTATCVHVADDCPPFMLAANGTPNLCARLDRRDPATGQCIYQPTVCAARGCNLEQCDPADGVCKVTSNNVLACGSTGGICVNLDSDGTTCDVNACTFEHCRRNPLQPQNCDKIETIDCAALNPSTCQSARSCDPVAGCVYDGVTCAQPADPCTVLVRDGSQAGCCSTKPRDCAAEFGNDPRYTYSCELVGPAGVCRATAR
jgi:Calcium-binding EGF domain